MPNEGFSENKTKVETKKELLLLTQGERPASVFFRGGEVRIDIHDAWYERTFKRLKADIVALHPDKSLSGFRHRTSQHHLNEKATAFRQAKWHFNKWILKQEQWYSTFGLKPPRVIGISDVTTPVYVREGGGSYIPPDSPRYNDLRLKQNLENKTKKGKK